jgi:16S rRNA (guanine527-N7)-methyltransferase
MNFENFSKMLDNIDLKITSIQYQMFEKYFKFLESENKKYNLTSITTEDEVFEKHFYDSLSVLKVIDLSNKLVVDVGAGAGFPLLPLKIVKPSIKATLVDATLKKVNFINTVAKDLNLDVEVINGRVEELKGKYDVVVARALAPLNQLLEIISNLIDINGYLIALKGSNYRTELKQAEKAMNVLGFELVNVVKVLMPNSKIEHYNLLLKKVKKHDGFYPRSYSKISKNPL